ncbi:DUF72 domain-containing protein [Sulfurihydrogenibium sp.]|jgi:uncharacterized protein YecE (DUF72 family)|uniref:DUF72 domain-containing protein n=1 Tax=Sulfurihydrogenibium sp. TaxID=2053621 RepID=UPI002626D50D|nr:DUF72 domain-containing protein [Sulfurihydrogenibium sp.]
MKDYIGCSGFFYYGWKGRFYPLDLKPNQWFTYYATKFKTVEINSTFYNFPKKISIKRFYKISPEDFKFSVKVNKAITHIKRFNDVQKDLNEFYEIVSQNLEEKLGVFLFQLPPSFKYSEDNLEKILSQIDKRYKNAIEFRHKSWWNQEVYDAFRKENLIFCSISAPKLPEKLIQTSTDLYIRFHGKVWYNYQYSKDELISWAEKIKNLEYENSFIYFNNDYNAYAPKNALELIELLNKTK